MLGHNLTELNMEKVSALIDEINKGLPKKKISYGYLGNIYFSKGKRVDDTSWRIFVPPTEREFVKRTYKSRIEGQEGLEKTYTASVGSAPYGDSIGGYIRDDDTEGKLLSIVERLMNGETVRTNSGADFKLNGV